MGISLAEAVRVFLGRVVSENAFPFPLHAPNEETAAALRDSIASDHKRYRDIEEMFEDLEKGRARSWSSCVMSAAPCKHHGWPG